MKLLKYLYAFSAIISIGVITIAAFSFSNLNLFQNLNSNAGSDGIYIDSVSVTDAGYRCFTTPCTFLNVSFNLTFKNSVEKDLGSFCSNDISLNLLNGTEWFNNIGDSTNNTCSSTNNTLPKGTWQESYSTIISLSKMPSSNESVPTVIDVQLVLANDVLTSPVYHLNLKL